MKSQLLIDPRLASCSSRRNARATLVQQRAEKPLDSFNNAAKRAREHPKPTDSATAAIPDPRQLRAAPTAAPQTLLSECTPPPDCQVCQPRCSAKAAIPRGRSPNSNPLASGNQLLTRPPFLLPLQAGRKRKREGCRSASVLGHRCWYFTSITWPINDWGSPLKAASMAAVPILDVPQSSSTNPRVAGAFTCAIVLPSHVSPSSGKSAFGTHCASFTAPSLAWLYWPLPFSNPTIINSSDVNGLILTRCFERWSGKVVLV